MNLKETKVIDKKLNNFGVVLCGGGAAGRWQAGVLTALQQIGVLQQAKVLVGTSVGGLNTGIFGLHNKPGDMVPVNVWESITKNEHIYKGSTDNIFGKIGAAFGFLTGAESIYDPTPLYGILNNVFGNRSWEQVGADGGMNVIVSNQDLNDQIEEFYRSFDISGEVPAAEALKMTSAIPGAFRSIKRQDSWDKFPHWHVDGGVGANNPFIALDLYNNAFPGAELKKAIIVYCYPDAETDVGLNSSEKDAKEYKSYKDVLLRTIPAMLNTQEQQVEQNVERMVNKEGWDVVAFFPKTTPCGPLDFTKTQILQDGYDAAVGGMVFDYKTKAPVNLIDFLTR